MRQEAGRDCQETVVISYSGESTVEPGRGEVMKMKVLVDVPRLEGGAEKGGGQSSQHSPGQQHQEVGPHLSDYSESLRRKMLFFRGQNIPPKQKCLRK